MLYKQAVIVFLFFFFWVAACWQGWTPGFPVTSPPSTRAFFAINLLAGGHSVAQEQQLRVESPRSRLHCTVGWRALFVVVVYWVRVVGVFSAHAAFFFFLGLDEKPPEFVSKELPSLLQRSDALCVDEMEYQPLLSKQPVKPAETRHTYLC